MRERRLIDRIRGFARTTKGHAVVLGIGDDCAALAPSPGSHVLVTTDFSIEGVHFRQKWHPAASVGHRCLARGLSDIAAMGGKPLACFLSLGLPPKLSQALGRRVSRRLHDLAAQFKVRLAGGDSRRPGRSWPTSSCSAKPRRVRRFFVPAPGPAIGSTSPAASGDQQLSCISSWQEKRSSQQSRIRTFIRILGWKSADGCANALWPRQ